MLYIVLSACRVACALLPWFCGHCCRRLQVASCLGRRLFSVQQSPSSSRCWHHHVICFGVSGAVTCTKREEQVWQDAFGVVACPFGLLERRHSPMFQEWRAADVLYLVD